jgi:hypothetical protein
MFAQQDRQTVLGRLQSGLQRRDLRPGALQVVRRLFDVQGGCEARLDAHGSQLVGLGLRRQIGFGDREPGLERAHLDVVQRDFAEQRHQHVAQILPARLEFCRRRFDRAADASNTSTSQPASSPTEYDSRAETSTGPGPC